MGLIDVGEVKQRRPREDSGSVKSASFKYHLLIGSKRTKVCLKAFCSAFDIGEKRVRRLRDLKCKGKTVCDKRGRHISFSLPENTKAKVREHIESFPLKDSHYSGKKIYYLNAELNLKIMHRLYSDKYPERVSYDFYVKFFRENFNYRFGRPQVDTCCECESLKTKIKSPNLNDIAKRTAVAELLVHKRRSKKFYAMLQYESSNEAKLEKNVLALAFDYMQNVQLPKIPVQELFYLRQLTVSVFCITDIKAKKSSIYLYHEGEGKKGPDEVCSMLHKYLQSSNLEEITELRIFSDNCGAQNKNQPLSRYLLYLTDSGKFQKVQHFFPVRGHSFLPCDRDFGIIKKRLAKYDRIFSLPEIIDHIKQSGKPGKFTVNEVKATDVLDFKGWWKRFYKKTTISEETKNQPREERVQFGISALFHFVYDANLRGYIKGFPRINGLVSHTFFMALCSGPIALADEKAYPDGNVPIKTTKKKDLAKIIDYIPSEHLPFYNEILNWPSCDHREDE